MEQFPDNPIELFASWFEEAKATDLEEPTAMTLATATKEGVPSARVVLLKQFDERGFCFFTNLTSHKGKELAANPKASLCFYWEVLGKQVRIDGDVERVDEKESDDYFASRARESQIGAWASKQSYPMKSREELVERVRDISQQFSGQPVPRPPFWSGFRVVPHAIEFWVKGEARLHTRIKYQKEHGGWYTENLYP